MSDIDVKSMSDEDGTPVVELAYAMGQQVDDTIGRSWCETYARLALEHLREHPELLFPVMTAKEAYKVCTPRGTEEERYKIISEQAPFLVIPDPDPPTELVPSVEDVMKLANSYAFITVDRRESGERLREAITRLVEAANGGEAK